MEMDAIVRNVSRGPEQSEPGAHRTIGRSPFACGSSRSVGGQLKSSYLEHRLLPPPAIMSSQHSSSSPNLVGGHYRVGRKIGEGSFGVIFEGLLLFPPLFPVPPSDLNPFSL